jgi:hypothetical protein
VKAHEAREVARADSLLADVRNAEGRAERLYGVAEYILDKALEAEDLKAALNAIRAAVDVMGEARQYMELRGELTGELPNVPDAAANVTLIKVLTVPRLPGVPLRMGDPPPRLSRPRWRRRVHSRPQNRAWSRRRSNRRTFPHGIAVEGRR